MIKRIFDIVFSAIGLILLSPILLFVAIWIKLDSHGPILFRQSRVGLRGNLFRIHKFRTMFTGSESSGSLTVGKDSRITKSGLFIRKYKIDELPQLIDVLFGDMSFVGPRPEVKEFMDMYSEEVRRKILSVKPGITDLASIEMIDENEILKFYDDPRDAYVNVIMPKKASYYVRYAERNNIVLDIYIIILTIRKIFHPAR